MKTVKSCRVEKRNYSYKTEEFQESRNSQVFRSKLKGSDNKQQWTPHTLVKTKHTLKWM